MRAARPILLATLAAILLAGGTAFGWNQRGHRISGSVVFRQLTPEARARVAALLRAHPRFADDFQARMPAAVIAGDADMQNEWIFQQAACWPDVIRGLPDPLHCQFHRATWHYINKPVWHTPADAAAFPNPPVNTDLAVPPAEYALYSMNVIQAIKHCRAVVMDPARHEADRALHLAWLFHTVGDIHQPLHAGTLVSARFPEGDRGGNSVNTAQKGNLHSLWDGFPGSSTTFTSCRNAAIALAEDADLSAAATAAAMQLDPEAWLAESHSLADSVAYDAELRAALLALPADADAPITLSASYLTTGGNLSRRQLAIASYRLTALLEELP